jgi:alkanesulfonate monooxygenase SsuD/methylene tetrahydromethanopterin reductase-like flavin-dependent oxidoreductase (luciferase family)
MKFGVFDHVDDSGLPLAEHLEARLRMAEAYDANGFDFYHVAEHHGTPLGLAPSPGILFAALSQRTTRLKFGPLVYLLPIYNPMRLVEEVAMLDALSNGRFQLGVGRGVSPIELGFHGLDMAEQRGRFDEALGVLIGGLSSEVLDFKGEFYTYDNVPMALRPVQRPHPPLWYGAGSPDSIRWCAQNGVNMVTLALGERVRQATELYRAEWQGAPGDIPMMGVSRHIVVADSDEEAKALVRPAYARWRRSMAKLWDERGAGFPLAAHLPEEWDAAEAMGHGCAGSPETVRAFVEREAAAGGINYFVSAMAFGDLPLAAVLRSAELFASRVMPGLGTSEGASRTPANS